MKKGITTITSEVILTIITISLAVPLLAYIGSLESKHNISDFFSSPLTCITYRYIAANKVLLYNDCSYNIKIYNISGTNTNYSILYYNDAKGSFMKTSIIYAKGLHLLVFETSLSKIVLNTSHGVLVLNIK